MNSVILVVLDGLGLAPAGPGNAVYLARPENINSYLYRYPNTRLAASGESVGLPAGEVGNTEVGHLNLGAGRIIYQSLPRINLSIADGDFYKNEVFLGAIDHVRSTGGKLHLIGLIGGGMVHASLDHLFALLFLCKENKIPNVFLHAITDGRDSPPKAAPNYITQIENKMNQAKIGRIASVMGRYFAMDRDRRWDRVEKAYRCLTEGVGKMAPTAQEAIEQSYKNEATDEFIEPTILTENARPIALIEDNDAVIFFNYRIDRPRELTKAFVLNNFEAEANKTSYDPYATKYFRKHLTEPAVLEPPFVRKIKVNNLYFVTMTEYEKNLPVHIAFPIHTVPMPLGRLLAEKEMPQLRLAESEKERFVGYYFNGEREVQFPREERLIVPSPKVPTYDLRPEMSAFTLTDVLVKKVYENTYPFVLINFANADMVGHTGNIQAAVKAIGALDQCLGRIVDVASHIDATVIITGDHGNAEEMINAKTGEISTEHSGNPVPFIVINKRLIGQAKRLQSGILADVAPTILSLLSVDKPTEMTGRNLLEEMVI